MNNNLVAQEWLCYAKQDLDSAIYLQKMQSVPVEIVCYHCQQSAEKYLKGFIAFHGGAIQRVHDLVALNKNCMKYDKDFMQIREECLNFTDYGVQARYPFNLEINENDARLAIKSGNANGDSSDCQDVAKAIDVNCERHRGNLGGCVPSGTMPLRAGVLQSDKLVEKKALRVWLRPIRRAFVL